MAGQVVNPAPAAASATSAQPLGLVLVVILATAAVVSVICRRFRMEAIPGYLVAGALVGPHALGLIEDSSAADPVTNLATVILLFTIGLQFDIANFRRGAMSIIVVSIVSTILYLALFWVVLLGAGLSAPVGLALAMAGCSASTAITLRVLQQRRELHEAHGRVSMGFSILDDLSGVVMLAAFPLVAAWGLKSAGVAGTGEGGAIASVETSTWVDQLLSALKAIGGVGAMLGLGRIVLPGIMLRVARLGSPEVLLICAAAIALLSAVWTGFIGFSPEMGAFLAGFMLAGTPLRYQLVGQLAPTRDLLMAIFFIAVGLVVNPTAVGQNLPTVLGLAAALMVIKLVTTGGCAWAAGMTARGACLTGVYNINAGEFTFVLLASATGLGIVTSEEAALAVAAAAVTLVATPLLVVPAHIVGAKLTTCPLAPWVRSNALRDTTPVAPSKTVTTASATAPGDASAEGTGGDGASAPPTPAPPAKPRHVIIAGFGPGGRSLADRLTMMSVPYVIVDLNSLTVQRQAKAGRQIVFGDISNPEVLEAAGLAQADAVMVTIPDDEAALRAVQAVRMAAPEVFIGVRMQFLSGKVQALMLGADEVVVAEVAVAVTMDKDMIRALTVHLHKKQGAVE